MGKEEVERTTETKTTDTYRTTRRIIFTGSKDQVDKAVDQYLRTGKLP